MQEDEDPRSPDDQDVTENPTARVMGDIVVYGAGLFNPWDFAAGRPDKPKRPRPAGW